MRGWALFVYGVYIAVLMTFAWPVPVAVAMVAFNAWVGIGLVSAYLEHRAGRMTRLSDLGRPQIPHSVVMVGTEEDGMPWRDGDVSDGRYRRVTLWLALAMLVMLVLRLLTHDGPPSAVVIPTMLPEAAVIGELPETPERRITISGPAPTEGLRGAERRGVVPVAEPPPPPITTPVGLWGLPYAPYGLDDCAEMAFYRVQFGLPDDFDAIGWRESNCRNEDAVRTSCCHGYWQLWVSLHLQDHRLVDRYRACGVEGHHDVNSDVPLDKQRQACAARALYDVVGMSAWSLTT